MKNYLFPLLFLLFPCFTAKADYEIEGEVSALAGIGSNDFAPFHIYANRHGVLTQSKDFLLDLRLKDPLSLDKRFDFSWGFEALGGITDKVDYQRWNDENNSIVSDNGQRPAPVWLQQLYAEVKWRSLFMSVGMKSRNSCLVDEALSSGDLIWSGNARPIPEVRVGFVDFQPVPFTNKWLQIDACLSYGKFADRNWIRNHYSYERGKINPGTLWSYKRLYFQSKPEAPFHAKAGFQMIGLFGGHTFTYVHGDLREDVDNYGGVKDFWDMLFPFGHGREGYKTGDHKGSWDISLRYRFKDNSTLRAYTQFFWEDGTGMSKSNGWDGLYGLEYKRQGSHWLTGAVIEFLEFMHQGGPLHYDPADDDKSLEYQVRGRDNYYNNFFYRSYVNYGMTIGTPLVMGTIFNLNGRPDLLYNRVRAFHLAAEGYIFPNLMWTAKFSHLYAKGQTNTVEIVNPRHRNSWMLGVKWKMEKLKGLTLSADIAADHGKLPMNAFGIFLGATYDCNLSFGRKFCEINPVD